MPECAKLEGPVPTERRLETAAERVARTLALPPAKMRVVHKGLFGFKETSATIDEVREWNRLRRAKEQAE